MIAVDETGNRYGRLLVIERDGSNNRGNATWLCRCDCGHSAVVVGIQLRSGQTRSCGCLKRETTSFLTKLPSGIGARNGILHNYKSSARHRGLEWGLTVEQFSNLTKQPCHYCGVKPEQIRPGYNGHYIYNGIDRQDNNRGYTVDNVVACCSKCNRAKGTMSVDEFLEWAKCLNDYTLTGSST